MFTQLIRWSCTFGLIVAFFAIHASVRAAAPAQVTPQATCPAALPVGEVFDCSISVGGETDSYTVTAQQNDAWFFRVLRTSGSFQPYIRLLNAASTQICANYTYGAYVDLSCSITTTGTYRLMVRDITNGSALTGNYIAYGQRVNSPAASKALDFGTQTSGQLQTTIEDNVFSFVAAINDKINLRVQRDSGAFTPSMTVYDDSGKKLCGDYTYGEYVGLDCTVNKTGTYYIFIEDVGIDSVGTYTLHLQRRNNPGNVTSINFGVPIKSNLNLSAEIDTYTFSAKANDKAFLRIYRSSGNAQPSLYVYNQAGDSVCGDYTYGAFVGFDCAINADGTYTMYVTALAINQTGNYTLYLQRSNSPGNATNIGFGQTLNGEIEEVGAFGTYTFVPKQDDKININFVRTAGNLQFSAAIYNAAGEKVCSNYSYGASLSINNCAIRTNGQHTILIFDVGNDAVGKYNFTLNCTTGTCGPPPPAPTLRPVLYLPMLQ